MINLNIYLLNGFIFLSYDFVDKKILIEMSRSKQVFSTILMQTNIVHFTTKRVAKFK